MSKAAGYIETESGNQISKRAKIQGSRYIVISGKTIIDHGACLRADLRRVDSAGPAISIGRYCIVGKNASLVPPSKPGPDGANKYYPMKIGSYVSIDENCEISAGSIGSSVIIGANCKIGKFSIIKDCVYIAPGTEIAPFTVVAPYSLMSGRPGLYTKQLPESVEETIELRCRQTVAGISVEAVKYENY